MHGLVETLARAMCIGAGNDPDVMVVSTNHPLERLNGHGDWSLIPTGFNVIPAWRVWEPEARVAVSTPSCASWLEAESAKPGKDLAAHNNAI